MRLRSVRSRRCSSFQSLRTPRHKAIASSMTPAKGRANTMVAVCAAAMLPALVLVLVLVLGTVFGSF